ncbi:AMP-binding protein [Bradyrhizobium cenepequi]|uniref:AMP-binding protein n=1 Tax=Bradyrhizobium cenepequi TaxID=2821403 RepID=UPI001CE318BF|nr:AMP-binding protein [Bradyrhizobium cenepequi]
MTSADYLAKVPYCPMPVPSTDVELTRREDGTMVLRSWIKLGETSGTICSFLPHWAAVSPNRNFLAQRNDDHAWQPITYLEFWSRVRSVGQALLDRGGVPGDTLAILSGNSIENAVMQFGAMSVGLQVAPISPRYSLLPGGLSRIEEIAKFLKPQFVFAQKADPYLRVRSISGFRQAEWVTFEPVADVTPLSELFDTTPDSAFDAAFAALGPDTVGRILFTSGSTGSPKGVINTHRMMLSALQMIGQVMPVSGPTVRLDWLPWHHTLGCNVNLNGILKEGGSLYIDDGSPTPDAFHRTIANLQDIYPTSYHSVPAGYALLCVALGKDPILKRMFFHRLERMVFAGAAISAPVMMKLQELAVEARGERIPIMSGYGSTETAPTICISYRPCEGPGEVGLPAPGVELKLVSAMDALEVRVRGPNVMPGYLGMPELSAAAFDEEGFYRTGDTVTFIDPADPSRGLRFSGRLSENFKIANGTWVLAGKLRAVILNRMGGVLQDLIVAGEGHDRLVALVWLNPDRARVHAASSIADASIESLAADSGVAGYICHVLNEHNLAAGTSERISAVAIQTEPPSLAAGEITDKAYINQRAVLQNRATVVAALYGEGYSPHIIRLHPGPRPSMAASSGAA